ncbi:MAG: hypothetical protein ACR2HS_05080 [Gammaproteobacteria bacterium]
MALWNSNDQANNAPKYTVVAGVNANGEQMFGNTQVSAFVTEQATGIFGVDTTEAGILTGEGKKVAHAGWNLRKAGSGPVTGIIITGGNVNYNTNGFITFTSTNGSGANASYTVNTVSNTISTITLNSGGSGYTEAPTATAANATGVNSATFTLTMGGRAGRVQYETLVAMGSIAGDAEDTIFPNS